jgi:hypothetical protein
VEDQSGCEMDPADVIWAVDLSGKAAVIRYATTIGEDRWMTLELQSLPTTLGVVNSKPVFRG